MILDKVQPFWTPEEEERLQEVIREEHALIDSLERKKTDNSARPSLIFDDKQLAEWRELDAEAKAIRNGVEDRYIASFSRKPKGVYKDIEEIVEAIEKEDFIARVREQIAQLASITKELRDVYGDKLEESNPNIAILRDLAQENYSNCYEFILFHLRVQLNAIDHYKLDLGKATAIIEKKVALWYVKTEPTFETMITSPALRAFAYADKKDIKLDAIKNAVIRKHGRDIFIEKYGELRQSLSINTDKLLDRAISGFTKQNHTGNTRTIDPIVVVPIRDYAKQLNYDIEVHETSTPEEAKKEKQRATYQLKNAKKAIKKDGEILYNTSIDLDLADGEILSKRRLFEGVDFDRDFVVFTFSLTFASYLAEQHTLTELPVCLRKIPANHPTSYYIGKKIAHQTFIYRNQLRGTDGILQVKTLLSVSNLATYEEVQKKDRGHWEKRIKEPFEKALEELVAIGLLESWEYTHSKGRALTEKEAYSINNYHDFEELYISYKVKDKPYQEDLIEANQKRKEEARQRAIAKNKKRKKQKEKAVIE